jgi:hypothetical protein
MSTLKLEQVSKRNCDDQYGQVNDAAQGQGECGIITTLVNQFNATNGEGIVVRTEVAEWGPYYDQLIARNRGQGCSDRRRDA